VAPMIAPVLGGVLEQYASWRVGFWLLAGLGAIVLSAAWATLPETHVARGTDPQNFFRNAGHLFVLRRFRAYTLTLGGSASLAAVTTPGARPAARDVPAGMLWRPGGKAPVTARGPVRRLLVGEGRGAP